MLRFGFWVGAAFAETSLLVFWGSVAADINIKNGIGVLERAATATGVGRYWHVLGSAFQRHGSGQHFREAKIV